MRRGFILTVALLALAVPAAVGAGGKVRIAYPNFSKTKGLKLNGDAAKSDKRLRLVTAVSDQTGTAFTTRRKVSPAKSFHVRFRFALHDSSTVPGDGMAFVMHPRSKTQVGFEGGGIGYGGIDPSLAVEVDLYDNDGPGSGDPNDNHVGVNKNGDTGTSLATGIPTFPLYGPKRTMWIDYTAKRKRLKVYVSTATKKPKKALIAIKRNLKDLLGNRKQRVGFTAATGGANMVADIFSFSLKQG